MPQKPETPITDTTPLNGAASDHAAAADSGTPTGAGKTVIVDSVVAKIVGIAAREVPGVFALGGGAARALGAIRDAISGTDLSQGVSITVEETRVSVEISLVVEYPYELQQVADNVRAAITDAIHTIVGMQVTAVDVTVKDVHHAAANPTETTTDDKPETPAVSDQPGPN